MRGIGQGTTLAGRYTLTRALAHQEAYEQWLATDTTLDREVTVTCFAADGEYAEAALDSARRAAGVEDHHLLRVLDVGTHEDTSFVVSEALHGAESIAAILQFDTVPAEEARRLVGESASGLNTAAARGLHHLTLNPHSIMRARDGSVFLLGLATDASLAGLDDMASDEASRADTVALVQTLYTAVTGQWPGDEEVRGLLRVKRRADGILPAPSELVTGVPGDLDTLCRTTLNADEGPRTPGELARQLSPWSSERVHGAGGRPVLPGAADDTGRGASAVLPGRPAPAEDRATDAGGDDEDEPFGTWPPSDEDDTMIGARPDIDADETTAFAVPSEQEISARKRPHHEVDGLEPPVPLLQTGTDDPDHHTSRLALTIVAVFVVLAVLLGAVGLRNLFDTGTPEPSTSPARSQAAAPTTTSAKSPTSTPKPTSGKPIKVTGISSFDPEGDQDEHNELAPRAIDGDAKTLWETHIYGSATYGGIKDGTGLILDLGSSKRVGTVSIDLKGGPTTMDVYVTKDPSIRDQKPFGTITDGKGTEKVTKDTPVSGRYVIIWITSLAPWASGQYRDQIPEIKVLT